MNTNPVQRSVLAGAGTGLALLSMLALPMLAFSGCTGGRPGDPENRGAFKVALVSTGLGQVFPYRIRQVDPFGNPSTTLLNIEDIDTLKNNVTANNPVLPVATFDTTAMLPSGSPGNQFLLLRFSHKLDIGSILSDALANQTNSGLTTAVSLLTYDPNTEATAVIKGRGFVNGYTYYNVGGTLQLVKAVEEQSGSVVVLDSRANGFPRNFTGDVDLVSKKSFVFIPDTDDDLTTFETFPTTSLLRIIVTNSVRDSEGHVLEHEVWTATTVGADPNPPDVLGRISGGALNISPGNGEANIDPTMPVTVRFNKPVQPQTVGTFFTANNLNPASGGITISVTAAANTFNVIYYADPFDWSDFVNYRVQPAYVLPGNAKIDFSVNNTSIASLSGTLLGQQAKTDYRTGDGPGVVNAPVAPEAIYVGIGGASPGLSVIDLNGFGQGTGDLSKTRFPLNPNIGAPGVQPTLSPGTSSLDAGSAGVFSLTEDTNGETRLLRDPLVGQIGDIQIGAPLDLVFNNENININATRANQTNPLTGLAQSGNTISIVPHPNPPPLVFPPPNPSTSIFGQEPTRTSSTGPPGNIVVASPPCLASPVNLLTIGNPFANTKNEVGVLGGLAPNVFNGPQPPPASPPPPVPYCPYTCRQQIGHFLYVLDRDNRQILVVNSNRMTVLDTIKLTDPYDMAVAPNVTTLAVTNFSSGSVQFIDINPLSATFNQVIGETRVEPGPTTVCYQPDGEDVLVLSTSSNSLSILNANDFSLRKIVAGFLNEPIDMIVTERYFLSGNQSNVYYAYILNSDGTIAVYESGPTGTNGIGFDDVIGTASGLQFKRARKLLYYGRSFFGSVLVAHVDNTGLGQVSYVDLTSSPIGPLPIQQQLGGIILPPTFRQKECTIVQRYGAVEASTPVKDLFSGNSIVDIAFDDILNNGGLPDQSTSATFTFSSLPAPPWGHSGKDVVKVSANGGIAIAYAPQFLFAALGDTGKVDVIDFGSGQKIATIDVPGVSVLSTYWRQ